MLSGFVVKCWKLNFFCDNLKTLNRTFRFFFYRTTKSSSLIFFLHLSQIFHPGICKSSTNTSIVFPTSFLQTEAILALFFFFLSCSNGESICFPSPSLRFLSHGSIIPNHRSRVLSLSNPSPSLSHARSGVQSSSYLTLWSCQCGPSPWHLLKMREFPIELPTPAISGYHFRAKRKDAAQLARTCLRHCHGLFDG